MQTSLTRDRKAPTVTSFADRRAEVINDVMVFSIMRVRCGASCCTVTHQTSQRRVLSLDIIVIDP